jgi:Ca2+-binding EF-hand superfamily protein
VHTTREEVEEFFQSMDRDFDGRLSFEEFMGEESTIEKLFKNMDKNGDGVVTKQEFHKICVNLSDEQVKTAFEKFDRSGDDRLDYREFCEMINKKAEEDAAAGHK